jgi:hypothetical protein
MRYGADPKPVGNLGAAMIAFPFQSLVAIGLIGAAGAVAAPMVQRTWKNFRL